MPLGNSCEEVAVHMEAACVDIQSTRHGGMIHAFNVLTDLIDPALDALSAAVERLLSGI
jgi:hypothetical protein